MISKPNQRFPMKRCKCGRLQRRGVELHHLVIQPVTSSDGFSVKANQAFVSSLHCSCKSTFLLAFCSKHKQGDVIHSATRFIRNVVKLEMPKLTSVIKPPVVQLHEVTYGRQKVSFDLSLLCLFTSGVSSLLLVAVSWFSSSFLLGSLFVFFYIMHT